MPKYRIKAIDMKHDIYIIQRRCFFLWWNISWSGAGSAAEMQSIIDVIMDNVRKDLQQ